MERRLARILLSGDGDDDEDEGEGEEDDDGFKGGNEEEKDTEEQGSTITRDSCPPQLVQVTTTSSERAELVARESKAMGVLQLAQMA